MCVRLQTMQQFFETVGVTTESVSCPNAGTCTGNGTCETAAAKKQALADKKVSLVGILETGIVPIDYSRAPKKSNFSIWTLG